MTKTFPRAIFEEAAFRAELDPSVIRDDYSGRGMFGDKCFGITHDSTADILRLFMVLGQLAANDTDDLADVNLGDQVWELAGVASEDGMGLSAITYFPGWQLSGGDDDGT